MKNGPKIAMFMRAGESEGVMPFPFNFFSVDSYLLFTMLIKFGNDIFVTFEKQMYNIYSFFQEWEGWSLLDSSYFCFITLTTIGFGDLVPDQNDTDGEIRIALNALYLLFGIALICMSFNLVQEEVMMEMG